MGLRLRKANAEDVLLLYEWVNEPEVRKQSLNSEPIPFQNHEQWFSARLADANTSIYIGSNDIQEVGQVRFDKVGDFYEIDYSVAQRWRGKGFGKQLIQSGVAAILKQDPAAQIKAVVKTGNAPSNGVFQSLGFELVDADHEKFVFVAKDPKNML